MSHEEELRRRIEAQIAARRAGEAVPRHEQSGRRGRTDDSSADDGAENDTTAPAADTASGEAPAGPIDVPRVLEPARPWLDAEAARLAAQSGLEDDRADEQPVGQGVERGPRTLDPVRPWLRRPSEDDSPGSAEQPPVETSATPDLSSGTGLRPARPWLARPEPATEDEATRSRRPEPKHLPIPVVPDEDEEPHRRGLRLWRRHQADVPLAAAGEQAAEPTSADLGVVGAGQRLEDAERRLAAAEARLAEAEQMSEASRRAEIEMAAAERDAEAQRRADAEARLAEAEQRLAEAERAARDALASDAAREVETERVRQALEERAFEAQRRAFAEERLAEAERRLADADQLAAGGQAAELQHVIEEVDAAQAERADEVARLAEAERVADEARRAEAETRLELERRLADAEQRLAEAERAAEIAAAAVQPAEPAEHRPVEPAPAAADTVAATPVEEPAPAALAARPSEPGRHAVPPKQAAAPKQDWTEITRERQREQAEESDAASGRASRPDTRKRRRLGHKAGVLVRLGVLVAVVAVVTTLLRAYVIGSYYIPSASMEPTLHGCKGCNNDHVLVNKLSYRMHEIRRGDVVVFNRPKGAVAEEKVLIKRVIGLPGDTLTDKKGTIYVNGLALDEPYLNTLCSGTKAFPAKPVKVPEGSIYVMGDNRCDSADSRVFGPVPTSSVIGRAFVIIWPLGRVHYL